MAVQTVPYIKANAAYYKLKLTAHNYTVYDLKTHDAMTYWFDEHRPHLTLPHLHRASVIISMSC